MAHSRMHPYRLTWPLALAAIVLLLIQTGLAQEETAAWGDGALGTRSYDDYQTPAYCGTSCHVDIYRQWQQAMMSQAYTHHWDEIEYFKLAVPHAEKDEKVAGVRAGCNGCHAPIAFLAGDVPPPHPAEGSRANESVSCDLCHTITGFAGDTPHNFNWISEPGKQKRGQRPADQVAQSPAHEMVQTEFIRTAEFCGTCHNEKSPYDVWVKSTHLEWVEGPYAAQGVRCQDCHMTYAPGKAASMGQTHPDVAQHLFHGAHVAGKVQGTIELVVWPNVREVVMGDPVKINVALFNQKTGHKFPTGSVEDRIVWLHVEATDAAGNVYHLPVDTKGFEGEEYTIGADVLAYQDMGIALDRPDFAGVQRDGVPVGDRIFRMPYFDPQGRMTIQQWNTASLGVDYRIGPRETKIETYSFMIPYEAAEGGMTIAATLYYAKLVKPVADFLEVPAEESEPLVVSQYATSITVIP